MTAVQTPSPGPDAGAVWHYGDPLGEQRTALTTGAVVDRSHRGVLALTGGDRRTWLHSLTTQHVAGLPEGAVVSNLSLDGQGRVEDAWVQTELADRTLLDTEPWRADPLSAYLARMVFWADVRVETLDWGVLTLLGPAVSGPAVLAALGVDALPPPDTAVVTAAGVVRTGPGGEVELLAPRTAIAAHHGALVAAGLRPVGLWAYEAGRVAAVRARLGVDTDERTIPHEVGWIGGPGAGAVHLDKGCYRGQETVARVHNLGRPPRMLALVHLDGSGRAATGDPLLAGSRQIGRVGTVAEHVDLGPVALALVKRGTPADLALHTGGEDPVAAVLDADSLPRDDHVGAGRLAVERLRGRAP